MAGKKVLDPKLGDKSSSPHIFQPIPAVQIVSSHNRELPLPRTQRPPRANTSTQIAPATRTFVRPTNRRSDRTTARHAARARFERISAHRHRDSSGAHVRRSRTFEIPGDWGGGQIAHKDGHHGAAEGRRRVRVADACLQEDASFFEGRRDLPPTRVTYAAEGRGKGCDAI